MNIKDVVPLQCEEPFLNLTEIECPIFRLDPRTKEPIDRCTIYLSGDRPPMLFCDAELLYEDDLEFRLYVEKTIKDADASDYTKEKREEFRRKKKLS